MKAKQSTWTCSTVCQSGSNWHDYGVLLYLVAVMRMTLLHYCWPIAYKFDRRRQKTGESWRRSIMALEEVHKKDEFDQILADSSRWAYCVSTIHLACAERKKNDFFNGLKSCKIPKANVHIKISWLQMKKIYFGLLYYWLLEPYSFFFSLFSCPQQYSSRAEVFFI